LWCGGRERRRGENRLQILGQTRRYSQNGGNGNKKDTNGEKSQTYSEKNGARREANP